jgi:hypothetical protein
MWPVVISPQRSQSLTIAHRTDFSSKHLKFQEIYAVMPLGDVPTLRATRGTGKTLTTIYVRDGVGARGGCPVA